MISMRNSRLAALTLAPLLGTACAKQEPNPELLKLTELSAILARDLYAVRDQVSTLQGEVRQIKLSLPDYSKTALSPLKASAVAVRDNNSFRSGVVFRVNYSSSEIGVLTCLHAFNLSNDVLNGLQASDKVQQGRAFQQISADRGLKIGLFVAGVEGFHDAQIVAFDRDRDLVALRATVPNAGGCFWATATDTEPTAGDAALIIGNPNGIPQVFSRGTFSGSTTRPSTLGADTKVRLVSIVSSYGDSGAPIFNWNSSSGRWEWAGILFGAPVATSATELNLKIGAKLPEAENSEKDFQAAGIETNPIPGLSLMISMPDIAAFINSIRER